MLDVGRADAETERAECAVRRGVAITRGDDHSWKDEALLGRHHMLAPLQTVEHSKELDAEVEAIEPEILDLPSRTRVDDLQGAARACRVHVIHDAKRRARP